MNDKDKFKDSRIQVIKEDTILENMLLNISYSIPKFEKGDIGKILMFYEPIDNHISLDVLKYNSNDIDMKINPNNKEELRKIFVSYQFSKVL